MPPKPRWDVRTILELVRQFQPACVVVAAAELDLFTLLRARALSAEQVAGRVGGDLRATAILLDALAALGLLAKRGGAYRAPAAVAAVLAEQGAQCRLGMVRHLGNCLRSWDRLAGVIKTGKPARRPPSVRGADEDLASFIRAMHEISLPMAAPLIRSLGRLRFTHLLDIGGASGTWTIPFLRLHPRARATIFDLPDVIPMAKRLVKRAGLADRVSFAAGSYLADALPPGADLAWVSAIVHQNSRAQNRTMFAALSAALAPGGCVLVRDVFVDGSRTRPAAGALFAVNMLVSTPGGGTYTFREMREDLEASGFAGVQYLRRGEGMDSVLRAAKPVRRPRP